MRAINEIPEDASQIEWMTTEDAAAKWEVSKRAAQNYCRDNYLLLGAYKESGVWHIPVSACPPLKNKDLRDFLIRVLKFQNAKMTVFPMDATKQEWCLRISEKRGYAISGDKKSPICVSNLIVTEPSGWNLVMGNNASQDYQQYLVQLIPTAAQITIEVGKMLLSGG